LLITVDTTDPPFSTPRAQASAREQREQRVAVDGLAALVDHHAAVAVAVERDPDVAAHLAQLRAGALRVERAARVVDVAPVRLDPEREHLGAELAHHDRADLVGGAVGAVEHHPDPVERQLAREALLEEYDVTAGHVVDSARSTDPVRVRPVARERAREDQLLHPHLGLVRQLEAVAREELDPVVLVAVVAGRDHHARIAAHVGGQERHSGRRHRSDLEHVDAHRADPGGHRVLEQVAREAGVLADDDLAPLDPAAGEHVRHGLTERERHLGGHRVLICAPADAVGAEQPLLAHRCARPPRFGISSTCTRTLSGRVSSIHT
jgi:hypothetical protein